MSSGPVVLENDFDFTPLETHPEISSVVLVEEFVYGDQYDSVVTPSGANNQPKPDGSPCMMSPHVGCVIGKEFIQQKGGGLTIITNKSDTKWITDLTLGMMSSDHGNNMAPERLPYVAPYFQHPITGKIHTDTLEKRIEFLTSNEKCQKEFTHLVQASTSFAYEVHNALTNFPELRTTLSVNKNGTTENDTAFVFDPERALWNRHEPNAFNKPWQLHTTLEANPDRFGVSGWVDSRQNVRDYIQENWSQFKTPSSDATVLPVSLFYMAKGLQKFIYISNMSQFEFKVHWALWRMCYDPASKTRPVDETNPIDSLIIHSLKCMCTNYDSMCTDNPTPEPEFLIACDAGDADEDDEKFIRGWLHLWERYGPILVQKYKVSKPHVVLTVTDNKNATQDVLDRRVEILHEKVPEIDKSEAVRTTVLTFAIDEPVVVTRNCVSSQRKMNEDELKKFYSDELQKHSLIDFKPSTVFNLARPCDLLMMQKVCQFKARVFSQG